MNNTTFILKYLLKFIILINFRSSARKKENKSIVYQSEKKKKILASNELTLLLTRNGESDNYKSKFKSSLKPNRGNASTSSFINVEDQHSKCMNVFELNEPSCLESAEGKEVEQPLIEKNCEKVNLIQIEKLHKNYFNKFVQDNIVIIANLMNSISESKKYYQVRIDESLKQIFAVEKLREEINAIQLHERHKNVLEKKLENIFKHVISSFDAVHFDLAFQMLFLSILVVFQTLDQSKFNDDTIFENLVLLLDYSLKNSEHIHSNISSILQSNKFRCDCINLKSLIEDSRNTDPGITDRMPLYFVKTPQSLKYFQLVIDAVTTSDSNEDLELLVNNAIFHCYIKSELKDPVDL